MPAPCAKAGQSAVGYNVQNVVDAKHKLIVHPSASDLGLGQSLAPSQLIPVHLPVEAVLAFLQAQPTGLQSLQKQQALAVAIAVDPVAIPMAL